MRSVEYPEDWFYVERACVMMFWLCAQIDPNLDTMAAGFPYVMPLIEEAKRRGPRRSELPPPMPEESQAPAEPLRDETDASTAPTAPAQANASMPERAVQAEPAPALAE
jgi:hypothetical protein